MKKVSPACACCHACTFDTQVLPDPPFSPVFPPYGSRATTKVTSRALPVVNCHRPATSATALDLAGAMRHPSGETGPFLPIRTVLPPAKAGAGARSCTGRSTLSLGSTKQPTAPATIPPHAHTCVRDAGDAFSTWIAANFRPLCKCVRGASSSGADFPVAFISQDRGIITSAVARASFPSVQYVPVATQLQRLPPVMPICTLDTSDILGRFAALQWTFFNITSH